LKKKAGYEERKSKLLKEGRHFDTLMDAVHEQEGQGEPVTQSAQDDINSLEFSLVTDNRNLQRELTSHKLNDVVACVVKMIVAAGLYPQYAVVDPTNNFRTGHDQFVHSSSKPFCVLHPNSALGQTPEVLRLESDLSPSHQLIYYGLLLETTKPYVCNSTRIPAIFLLITARNVSRLDSKSLSCDGFVELKYHSADDCSEVLERAIEIRKRFLFSIDQKLRSDDYGSYRDLEKRIVNFAKLHHPFAIRRLVDPPKLQQCGIFTESGEEHPSSCAELTEQRPAGLADEEELEQDKMLDEQFDAKKLDDHQLKGRHYFCERCERMMWFEDNVAILRHKRSHA